MTSDDKHTHYMYPTMFMHVCTVYVCLFLDEIVSNGETDYFSVDDFNMFDQILDQIRLESCRLSPPSKNKKYIFLYHPQ